LSPADRLRELARAESDLADFKQREVDALRQRALELRRQARSLDGKLDLGVS